MAIRTSNVFLIILEYTEIHSYSSPFNLNNLICHRHGFSNFLVTTNTGCANTTSSGCCMCDGHTWGLARQGWTGGGGHRSVFILARAPLVTEGRVIGVYK